MLSPIPVTHTLTYFFSKFLLCFFGSDSGGTDVENNLLKDNFKWNMLNKKPRGVFEGYIKGGIKGFIIFELLACAGAYAFYHRCNTNRGKTYFLSVGDDEFYCFEGYIIVVKFCHFL